MHNWPIECLTDWPIEYLTDWPIECLTDWPIEYLTDWPIECLNDRLNAWLTCMCWQSRPRAGTTMRCIESGQVRGSGICCCSLVEVEGIIVTWLSRRLTTTNHNTLHLRQCYPIRTKLTSTNQDIRKSVSQSAKKYIKIRQCQQLTRSLEKVNPKRI